MNPKTKDVALFTVVALGFLVGGMGYAYYIMPPLSPKTDLSQWLSGIRGAVNDECGLERPVYLDMKLFEEHKMRQLILLYLTDRDIKSDWSSDVYFSHLPPDQMVRPLAVGDCLISPILATRYPPGKPFGAVTIGVYRG